MNAVSRPSPPLRSPCIASPARAPLDAHHPTFSFSPSPAPSLPSAVVFNIALSRVVLKRELNRWHVVAAALCLAAAATLGLLGSQEDASEGAAGHRYAVGIPAALGAAFCIAASSIVTDKITRDWPDKDAHIVEMTIVASLAASLLLVPTLFALGEDSLWRPQLSAAWADPRARAVLIGLTLAMPVVKSGSRVSKYECVSHSSALFFEFVQASAALVSALANVLVFPDEHFSVGFVAAAVLIALSFGAYGKARQVMKAKHAAEHLVGVRHHHNHRHQHHDHHKGNHSHADEVHGGYGLVAESADQAAAISLTPSPSKDAPAVQALPMGYHPPSVGYLPLAGSRSASHEDNLN